MTVFHDVGARLAVEEVGAGPDLVLVHGAWTDRHTWDPVFAKLAARFHTVRYDRRGYGESEGPGAGRGVHTADLLALLRRLGLARVMLVGNSLGALIAIRAALAADGLVASVVAHEPPLLGLLAQNPAHRALVQRAHTGMAAVLHALRAGEHAAGACLFFEQVASLPGTWQHLPAAMRSELVQHAPAFLAEADASDDPDAGMMARLAERLVLTRGERSSPYLRAIAEELSAALPHARGHVFAGAGHVPHQSKPDDFVAMIRALAADLAEPR